MSVFVGSLAGTLLAIPITWRMMRQCRKPSGLLGRLIVRTMNHSHAELTSCGLRYVSVKKHDAVLDVGCGGGRTVHTMAKLADLGIVHGVDYSSASVAASKALNRAGILSGRVVIQNAAVSRLPFPDDSFDLITAVETHYYWPNLPGDMREIRHVLKPGGTLLMLAEAYRTAGSASINQLAMKPLGGALLSPDDHRELFLTSGYADVQMFLERAKGCGSL
jgi:SAM-dependent methyltransferase